MINVYIWFSVIKKKQVLT